MDLIPLVDTLGEGPTATLFGLLTGGVFGVAAQRSRFCLRAAVVERARQQQPEAEAGLHSSMANMQMEDPGDTVITGKFHVLSAEGDGI